MNRWNIPEWLELEVKARDIACVYCGKQMSERSSPERGRRDVATWEHIVNDARMVTRENIARCCAACNASKGTKDLTVWLQSNYCMQHGINAQTVTEVVRQALRTRKTEAQPATSPYSEPAARSPQG